MGSRRNEKLWINQRYAFFVQISLKMKFLPQHWLFDWLFFWTLYVFFKSKLIISFNPQKLFTARTWKLLITNMHMMAFLSLKRRWHLSGFTFLQLFQNHKVRLSATLLISLITSNSELPPTANGVLSSA